MKNMSDQEKTPQDKILEQMTKVYNDLMKDNCKKLDDMRLAYKGWEDKWLFVIAFRDADDIKIIPKKEEASFKALVDFGESINLDSKYHYPQVHRALAAKKDQWKPFKEMDLFESLQNVAEKVEKLKSLAPKVREAACAFLEAKGDPYIRALLVQLGIVRPEGEQQTR